MKIAGYILSGGKNSRMQGRKKLFLTFQKTPFYTHIIKAMSSLHAIYLSVDQIAPYEETGLPLIKDIYPEIGPVGGIYTGLIKCEEDALFVTACDMPLIKKEHVETLIEIFEKNEDCVVIAQSGGRLHPLFGIYPKSILPVLTSMIEEENYRVRDVAKRTKTIVVTLPEDGSLKNINTPKEYEDV
ncbi:MAG: molybdenum cofactor guanylyltransferase [Lachnospiraceae bacterium]|nr:molybdenum cofactor guanylyltransferase [Lachnospiraceae bacterium]